MRFSGHVLWASSSPVSAANPASVGGELSRISGRGSGSSVVARGGAVLGGVANDAGRGVGYGAQARGVVDDDAERGVGRIKHPPLRQPHEWVEGVFEVRDGKIYRVAGADRPGSGSRAGGAGVANFEGRAGGAGFGCLADAGSGRTGGPVAGSVAGSASSSEMVDYSNVWVVPGLVDAHCHIGIGPQGETAGEVMLAQAHANRDAGVLLARDCGVIGDNSWASGREDGLTILRAGRHITKAKRYIRGYALEVEDRDLPAAMVEQARVGSGWVKIVGDWIDRANGTESDLDPLWETSALVDGVAAVHEAGARVTVHTFGERTIDGLLEAGVDCIEHGTGMRPEHAAEAAARGIAVTPTLMQMALFPRFAEAGAAKYPVYAQTMTRLWERHEATLGSFLEAGVQLLPGTDAGGYQEHGRVANELALWRAMGLADEQIVDLGTWRAREFLGVPGLSEGADADLVMYEQDPRADVQVLQRPALVLYRGKVRG